MSVRFPDELDAEELDALRGVAKEALRKRMSQLRRALPEATRKEHAHALCALLAASPEFAAADVVLAYAPLRFEIDPGELVRAAHALGKSVALPRVDSAQRSFSAHLYRPGDVLAQSGHLIDEPSADAPIVDLADISLVLVPGLAFDGNGQRLGFGQGYYDRMLPLMTRARRVGLCYELSLLPEIPSSAHDVPMHVVATPRRLLTVV